MWQKFSHLISLIPTKSYRIKRRWKAFKNVTTIRLPWTAQLLICPTVKLLLGSLTPRLIDRVHGLFFLSLTTKWSLLILLELCHYTTASLKSSRISPGNPCAQLRQPPVAPLPACTPEGRCANQGHSLLLSSCPWGSALILPSEPATCTLGNLCLLTLGNVDTQCKMQATAHAFSQPPHLLSSFLKSLLL